MKIGPESKLHLKIGPEGKHEYHSVELSFDQFTSRWERFDQVLPTLVASQGYQKRRVGFCCGYSEWPRSER